MPRRLYALAANQRVNVTQDREKRFQSFKREHVRAVRWSALGVLVYFHEDRIHTTRDPCTRKRFDVL